MLTQLGFGLRTLLLAASQIVYERSPYLEESPNIRLYSKTAPRNALALNERFPRPLALRLLAPFKVNPQRLCNA